jgi:copper oxidase (laccase) domain-containing protein
MTTTSTSRRSSSNGPLHVAGPAWEHRTDAGAVRVVESSRADGDFHLDLVAPAELAARRRRLVDLPWTMLDERHGTRVVRVRVPGGGDRQVGDIAVTDLPDAVLGVWVGDCAPVVLVTASGEIAVVHAGWRGLAAGVIDVAVSSLRSPPAAARLGPCVGPCCYEFGPHELQSVAAGVHAHPDTIASATLAGGCSLDVAAAIRSALAIHGVELSASGRCTGCDATLYSHRVRRDTGRQVVAAWRTVG